MAKRALVISGGGSKGAFAVGAIRSLTRDAPGTTFDIYVGTSTGSLIVPFAAMDALDQLERIYTTVTTKDIVGDDNVADRFLGANSLLDASPLARLITANCTDAFCRSLFQSSKLVCLVATCLQTADSTYFANKDMPADSPATVEKISDPTTWRNAIMASACQPVLMPPITVDTGKVPLRQYVDGGVRVYAGIQFAIDAGADEIYAILLSPSKADPIEINYERPFPILERTVGIFEAETAINNLRQPMLYSAGLQYIADVKAALLSQGVSQVDIDRGFAVDAGNPFSGRPRVKIFVIRPDVALGGGPGGLIFDPTEMKGMMAKGETITSEFLANLPPNGSNLV
jgi:predicted acylesterase/phospholipase RssA